MNTETVRLTNEELNALKDILDAFERREYRTTGMSILNGGFVKADMFNYDDETIDIELAYGIQDMDGEESSVELYTLDRDILLKDIPVKDKVMAIKVNN